IDGEFADNTTITPADLQTLIFGSLSVDIHLMTVDPINDVSECESIPNMRAVIGQVERMSSQSSFIEHVKSYNWKVGLSLDLYTPISAIDNRLFSMLDIVQIMSIHAGSQGQEFKLAAIEKIKELRTLIRKASLHTELIVDGGLNPQTLRYCKDAGAGSFSVGSYLWSSCSVAESLKQLLY
ncbi:MAG TPA: hypothetical protein VJ246_01455, partial [Patescibacteria group bacterium]|nr:hypothetical protein [Patescibacteria group bacterium]